MMGCGAARPNKPYGLMTGNGRRCVCELRCNKEAGPTDALTLMHNIVKFLVVSEKNSRDATARFAPGSRR
jgi:hypothetical protein